jgi:hypothetical protein
LGKRYSKKTNGTWILMFFTLISVYPFTMAPPNKIKSKTGFVWGVFKSCGKGLFTTIGELTMRFRHHNILLTVESHV